MSDRRFMVLLVSTLAAGLGVGIITLATLGLQDPIYRDFDTGVATDTSRTLTGLMVLGAVLVLGGVGTTAKAVVQTISEDIADRA